MTDKEQINRLKGALIGAFIGDALGVGCHWYYNLDEMHRECGEWIDDYTKPKKGRYHEHLKAGDASQSGYILKLMVQSLIDNEGYNKESFCNTLEDSLFTNIDGSPMGGIGGYTSQSIREVYRQRKQDGLSWDETGSDADTTEALERDIAIALAYAFDEEKLAYNIYNDTKLTQKDEMVVTLNVAYSALLSKLVKGHYLDENISSKLMDLVKQGKLPFHTVTSDNLNVPGEEIKRLKTINFTSPDALLSPSYMAQAANDEDVQIEPAWKVSLVYGMPCAIYHILPACYYLSARFKDDFESGVLHALNGGGQNMARAMLRGALIGAQVGFDAIPKRFIDGLTDKDTLLDLADRFCKLPFIMKKNQ